jgi:hypothetical protein
MGVNMPGKLAKAQLPLFLILTMTLSLALPAYAQPLGIPQEFRGSITVNGSPPPQGSTVSVRTGGNQVATTTTDAQGRYGYSSPLVVTVSTDALLEFYVNGVNAQETTKYDPGKVTTLNLTVVSGSASPPPSSPPTQTLSPTQPPLPAPSIASFAVSNLNVSPASVKPDEAVIVTADVKNSSSSAGTYKIALKVNGNNEVEQTITLSAGKTQKLVFNLSKPQAGEYSIAIDSQSTKFKVSAAETSWLTGQPWWMYAVIGISGLLMILVIILIIRRRNAYYY